MRLRLLKDRTSVIVFWSFTVLSISTLIAIGVGLGIKSWPLFETQSLSDLFFSDTWRPLSGKFGFLAFIAGTLWVTAISLILAVPISVLTALYLSEFAHPWVRKVFLPIIDVLSGIPPVVYGVWGVLVLVPLVTSLSEFVGAFSFGYSVLAGGLVLSLMITPLMISIILDVLGSIPTVYREASLSLGATRWETTWQILARKARPGILAAVILSLSRAFGETIAVLMVCGNMPMLPQSVFDAGYPLPALIANNYGEMMSIPLYDSALMMAGLVLFVVIVFFNLIARVVLFRLETELQ
ncbi:MAG: phosphate ABC transporter permease subunit PstC [Bacteroidetes bacterium]|nr:phosphate ABC transporter permease subunit PstC [Bacteroidota bacterium]